MKKLMIALMALGLAFFTACTKSEPAPDADDVKDAVEDVADTAEDMAEEGAEAVEEAAEEVEAEM